MVAGNGDNLPTCLSDEEEICMLNHFMAILSRQVYLKSLFTILKCKQTICLLQIPVQETGCPPNCLEESAVIDMCGETPIANVKRLNKESTTVYMGFSDTNLHITDCLLFLIS